MHLGLSGCVENNGQQITDTNATCGGEPRVSNVVNSEYKINLTFTCLLAAAKANLVCLPRFPVALLGAVLQVPKAVVIIIVG